MRRYILGVVGAHPERRISFSSFDSDAALRMREMQDVYPVMVISPCNPKHADPRKRSVEAAMEIALDGDLHGLVVNIAALAGGKDGERAAEEAGAYTRLLLSCSSAVSNTKNTLIPPKHSLNTP